MRRRSESPSKNERREPVCSERDIRVPERSEGGFPCRSEEHTGSWLIRVEKGPVLSVATSGCPKRSEDGCPCRSEDNTVPLLYLRRRAPPLLRAFPKPSPVEAKASAAFQTNQAEPSQPGSKNIKHLTYEATPNSATVNKLCFQPAQAHPRIRHRRIHVL